MVKNINGQVGEDVKFERIRRITGYLVGTLDRFNDAKRAEVNMEYQETDKTLRLCGVEPESIVDGPGFRFVIFVQGCPHHCPGCHNPQSHDFDGGYTVTEDELFDAIKENRHLAGVTFSGGEPFCQPEKLARLGKRVKEELGKTVMTYTGYTLEQLREKHDAGTNALLDVTDILVDGRYVEKLRDLTLLFRGSENQRVIDMNKTRRDGDIVLYDLEY